MFEDLDQEKGQVSASVPKSARIIPPPFQGGVSGGSTGVPPPAPKIEDMFAGVKDTAMPKPQKSGLTPSLPDVPPEEESAPSGNGLRNIIIIVIVLAILGAGIFLASRFVDSSLIADKMAYLKSLVVKEKPGATIVIDNETQAPSENMDLEQNQGGEIAPNEPAPADNFPAEDVSGESTSEPELPAATTTPPAVIATTTPAADADADGLTDSEEAALGTNPLKVDTDEDGLTDYQEVKIYYTGPLNADTDGDGYLDGAEIKSGYDPNGPGKLQ